MLKFKMTKQISHSIGRPLMIDERTLRQNLFIIINEIKKVDLSTQSDAPVSRYSRYKVPAMNPDSNFEDPEQIS